MDKNQQAERIVQMHTESITKTNMPLTIEDYGGKHPKYDNLGYYAVNTVLSGDPKILGQLFYSAIEADIETRQESGLPCTTLFAFVPLLDALHRYVNNTPDDERVPGLDSPDYIKSVVVGDLELEVRLAVHLLPNSNIEFMII